MDGRHPCSFPCTMYPLHQLQKRVTACGEVQPLGAICCFLPSMGTSRHSVTFHYPLKGWFWKTFCTTDPFIHTVPMNIAGAGNPCAVRWVESLLNMLENLQNVLIAIKITGLHFWVLEASQLKLLFFNLLFTVFCLYHSRSWHSGNQYDWGIDELSNSSIISKVYF